MSTATTQRRTAKGKHLSSVKPLPEKAPAKAKAAKSNGHKPAKATAKRTTRATPKKSTGRTASTATRDKRTAIRREGRHGPYALVPVNEFGFAKGTDVAVLMEQMVAGGYDRKDIVAKVRQALGNAPTRSGGEKNIPSLMSMLLAQLHEDGYQVTSWWQLIPPDEIKAKLSKTTRTQMAKVERVVGRRPIR